MALGVVRSFFIFVYRPSASSECRQGHPTIYEFIMFMMISHHRSADSLA